MTAPYPQFRSFFLKATFAETRRYLVELEKGYLERPPVYQKASRFRGLEDSEEADRIALAAGKRLKEGMRTREDLDTIYDWKNGGSRFWNGLQKQFSSNSDARRERALIRAGKATQACDWRAAILCIANPELMGVQVRTASAILTCIYPDEYTVLDELALRPLGIYEKVSFDADFYCYYLEACRKHQQKYQITLRSLDRAFWEWGKRHPQPPGIAPGHGIGCR